MNENVNNQVSDEQLEKVSGGGDEEHIVEYVICDDVPSQVLPSIDSGESREDYFKRLKALGYC